MKTGLTLEQLAAEITRQQSAKEDYVVNTGNLRLESYGPDLTLRVLDSDGADRIEPLEIGDIAHRQIGTHLSIPAKYYERMRSEDAGLLAHNVNTWLERTPAQRMIRVLDGKARAYLSNRYLRMDNYSIASAVLPILAEIPDVRIESCQITDSRMYIKAVNPRLQEDVTPGDTVQAGVVISNSEVGLGSVNMDYIWYASPNAEALADYPAYYEAEYEEPLDEDIYSIMAIPDEERARCELYVNLPQETLKFYDKLWTQLGV